MAYYNKKDIENYIRQELESIEGNADAKILTPISQPLTQLTNEEDTVGFCYVVSLANEDGQTLPKMQTKIFVRIDHDLYTDDRFALDQFQAAQEGKTVSQVISERHQEQAAALRELTGEDLNSISELYGTKGLDAG